MQDRSGSPIAVLGYVFGFVAAYAGERYVQGVGWVSTIATVATAIVAAAGFGVIIGR